MSTPERNAPCPCGSGKKYKQCCLQKQRLQPPRPLSMRQVVSLSTSKVDTAAQEELKNTQSSTTQTSPQAPSNPSYDSLMERVFGAANKNTKPDLEVKDKENSIE